MSDSFEHIKQMWVSCGASLALGLTPEAREAARLMLEAKDFAKVFAIIKDGPNFFDTSSWGNATSDALAARILHAAIQQSEELGTTEAVVIEALLLALVRYVGPLRFSELLSALMPSSKA